MKGLEGHSEELGLWNEWEIFIHSRNTHIRVPTQTSLVAQEIETHLPVLGTQVRALVREDSTCHGATKPVYRNC